MKRLSTIFLLLISISTAHAEEGIIKKLQEYDVEVIIFEDANARYINSENWPQEAVLATPAPEETTEPPENLDKLSLDEIKAIDENNTPPFKNIKPEILSKEYRRINNSKEYNVLFYGSWQQAGLDAEKAFEINLDELDNTHKNTSENTLTGTFKLVLARYLHFYSKLNYQRKLTATEQAVENSDTDMPSSEAVTREYENYQIDNHRRMRSKELHYIDHPLVGMLIQINPVKPSTETTTPLKTN
jgi:hypothetical protein